MSGGDYFAFYRATWGDLEWRSLTVDAQHAYLMLGSHPDRNRAGLLAYLPRKWTRLSADQSPERLDAAVKELDAAGFAVVDEDTGELLVRAYVRRSEVWRHVRLLNLALTDAESIESPRLRSAMGQELARLPRIPIPEPASRSPRARRFVDEAHVVQRRLDELVSQMCDAPPADCPTPADVIPSVIP